MPATKRRLGSGLIQRLQEEPYRFEFFQAVRLLLAHHRHHAKDQSLDALGQIVRFRGSISLAFPASEIESLDFEWQEQDVLKAGRDCEEAERAAPKPFKSVTLVPTFIGLTGPSGVLPRHYTQHLAERETYHRDTATRAFLDIFTTRAVALFYQSWLKYRPHFQYEVDRKNRFLPLVLSLAGLGMQGTRGRLVSNDQGVEDESLAYYASAIRQRPQSITWFARVVSDYFNVPCSPDQFVGQWFDLPEHERTLLGASNCILGETSFCGGRVWNRQSKVRLRIGPLRRVQFDDFLPGAKAFHSLRRLFRLMVGATFDCEILLILDKRDIGPSLLDSRLGSSRLGWNAWCKSADVTADSCDTSYLIKAADPVD